MSECYSCRQTALADAGSAPPRENVSADAHWRTAHAMDTSLPGWLVLLPRRHIAAISELTVEEAAGLGSWLRRVSIALTAETGCEKTYVMQFSEAPGFGHLHFHIVPRGADHPAELWGPRVFGALGVPVAEQVDGDEQDALALRLRAALPD